MTCSSCGMRIPEGQALCPHCRAPVRRPGLLERLFGWLASARKTPTVNVTRTTEIRQERFEIVDKDGKRQVYHSLDEVPPEFRSKIEEAMHSGQREVGTSKTSKITVRNASGREQTYDSVEDMPPDLRAIYDRIQRDRPS